MKTFRHDGDNQRTYLCSEIKDDYAEFKKVKKDLLATDGVRLISEYKSFEGPMLNMVYTDIPFTLAYDDILGGFLYVDQPDDLAVIEDLIISLN